MDCSTTHLGSFWVIILAWGMFLGQNYLLGQHNPINTVVGLTSQKRMEPRRYGKNPTLLAPYVTQNSRTEKEKVLAICHWIILHVKYDYEAFKERQSRVQTSIQVLQSRKALSREYAQLFKEMCAAVGIQAAVVTGYTKGFDFFKNDHLYRAEHVWSAVRIDQKWYLLDLTYASGHVEQKQPIGGHSWLKYQAQFRYVQELHPEWLLVAPEEMILTHFPHLNIYQLLEVPLPFELYKKGGWFIHSHLSWHYKTIKESPAIETYLQTSQLEQWKREGLEGHQNNPWNYHVRGQTAYWVLDSLFRRGINLDSNKINGMPSDLNIWEGYACLADSFLWLSHCANEQEFYYKKQQSLIWKTQLINQNKAYIENFTLQYNQIQKQKKRRQKWQQQTLKQQHFIIKVSPILSKKYSYKSQKRTRTTAILDTFWKSQTLAALQQDSLMQYFQQQSRQYIANKKQLLEEVYPVILQQVKALVQQKKQSLPLVYHEADSIQKLHLYQSYHLLDSINGCLDTSFLQEWRAFQRATFQTIKQYVELLKQEPKGVCLYHKNKVKEEKQANQQWMFYQKLLKQVWYFQQEIIGLWSKEMLYLKKIEQELYKEIQLEQYRHGTYMKYRQYIKEQENLQLQTMRADIDRMNIRLVEAR